MAFQHAHPFDRDRAHKRYIRPVSGSGKTQARFGRSAQTVLVPGGVDVGEASGEEPQANLKLDWVHGYNGGAVGSVHWVSDDEFVFPVGCIGIVQRLDPPAQRHFLGHSAKILCLAYCEANGLCASGQKSRKGVEAFVCIWSPRDCGLRSVLLCDTAMFYAVGFSPAGTEVFTYSGSERDGHSMAVWRHFVTSLIPKHDERGSLPTVSREPLCVVASGKVPAHAMSVSKVVEYRDDGEIVRMATYDAGMGGQSGLTLEFWRCSMTQDSRIDIVRQMGVFCCPPQERPRRVLCCSWSEAGSVCVVCGDNGYAYLFEGGQAVSRVKVCAGALGFASLEPHGDIFLGGFGNHTLYLGSMRGLWESIGEQRRERRSQPASATRRGPGARRTAPDQVSPPQLQAMALEDIGGALICATANLRPQTVAIRTNADGRRIALIGTEDLHLLLFDVSARRLLNVVTCSHRGETWALCHYPDPKLNLFATGSTYGTLRFWDAGRCTPVVGRVLKYGPAQGVYALDFNQAGDLLAVGHADGTLRVLTFPALQPALEHSATRGKVAIADARFSLDGTCLAVGCHDTNIYLFRVDPCGDGDGARISVGRTMRGMSATVSHVMFCNSSVLLASTVDGQIGIFCVHTGERHSQSILRDAGWEAPWTCTCGWPVMGMWSAHKEFAMPDINTCCTLERWGPEGRSLRDTRPPLLASGSMDGLITLYRFPAVAEEQQHKLYHGHGAAITRLRFMAAALVGPQRPNAYEAYLVSCGGDDRAIIQWGVCAYSSRTPAHVRRHCPYVPEASNAQQDRPMMFEGMRSQTKEKHAQTQIWGWEGSGGPPDVAEADATRDPYRGLRVGSFAGSGCLFHADAEPEMTATRRRPASAGASRRR